MFLIFRLVKIGDKGAEVKTFLSFLDRDIQLLETLFLTLNFLLAFFEWQFSNFECLYILFIYNTKIKCKSKKHTHQPTATSYNCIQSKSTWGIILSSFFVLKLSKYWPICQIYFEYFHYIMSAVLATIMKQYISACIYRLEW